MKKELVAWNIDIIQNNYPVNMSKVIIVLRKVLLKLQDKCFTKIKRHPSSLCSFLSFFFSTIYFRVLLFLSFFLVVYRCYVLFFSKVKLLTVVKLELSIASSVEFGSNFKLALPLLPILLTGN